MGYDVIVAKISIQKILLLLLFKIGLKEDTCRCTVDRSVEQLVSNVVRVRKCTVCFEL